MGKWRNLWNNWQQTLKQINESSGQLDPGPGIRIQDGFVSARVDNSTIEVDGDNNLHVIGGGSDVTKAYVDEHDAALQTQINNKQDKITDTIASAGLTDSDYMSDLSGTSNKRFVLTKVWDYIKGKITGAISTAIENNFIAGRALVTNASGKLIESQTSAVELSYVKDVTGPIQDQLDDKADKSTTYTKTEVDTELGKKLDKRTGGGVGVYSHSGTTQGELTVKTAMSSSASDSNILTEKGVKDYVDGKDPLSWNYIGILGASSGATLTIKDDWKDLLVIARISEGSSVYNLTQVMPKFAFTQGSPTANVCMFGFYWNSNYNANARLGLSGSGDSLKIQVGYTTANGWVINGFYIYKR